MLPLLSSPLVSARWKKWTNSTLVDKSPSPPGAR
jgi:hypothetical protein